uniref:Hypothetical conserved protein n=1 Tax=uncultured Planctomycetota bacterium TaxID=120965 RepID=H5SDG2_9BACT|nr:hypothetical conserved protein [uncultured Planctomycetota bacterium]
MRTWLALLGLAVWVGGAAADEIRGQYVEARTCDVWVGACFANAEMNLTGKNATLAWHIEKGALDGVRLDGLSVVVVVEARETLGLKQSGPGKAVILVDEKADARQREALVKLARKLGGLLTAEVVRMDSAPITISVGRCPEGGCALVEAGVVRIETRCIHAHEDSVCGHEDNFYAPLTPGVKANSAMVTEHTFVGSGLNKTWKDANRRGAYIGSFSIQN